MDYGTLRVTTPDGQVREYPIDTTSVLIGRADSNRVVIDHVSVSRRHARFVVNGDQMMVEDLGSATGTFVGGQRLAAETPRPLRPGEALRFGDAQAVFMVGAGAAEPPQAAAVSTSTSGAPAPVQRPPAAGRSQGPTDQAVVVSLVSPSAPVAAGATTNVTCVIENRGAEADQLVIEVQNLPAGWSRVTRPTIQLPPGGRDEVTIILSPPRTPEARAGEHQLAVAATSRLRGVEVRALGRMTILPFGGHSLELTPVRSKRAFNLKVVNAGNSPVSLALAGRDSESALAITVTPSAMDLEPGQTLPAKVEARTAKRRFFGKERIFPFDVEAQGPATKSAAQAELRSRPPWLIIRWFVLAAVVAAVAIGGWFAYQAFFGGDDAAPPAGPKATATAKPPTAEKGTSVPATVSAVAGITPAAAATIVKGGSVVITNSPAGQSTCLRAHPTPAVNAAITYCLNNDDTAKVIDGPQLVAGDKHIWWLVQKDGGTAQGWAAEANPDSGEKWMKPLP